MKATSGLRMATGNGDNSYASNSRLQEKAIFEARPVLHKAIEDVYTSLCAHKSTMVVAGLGCSSGPNTLLVVSEVLGAIRAYNQKPEDARDLEVQFFLNDLLGNDFNLLFRSLEQYANRCGQKDTPPYYIAGLPGSYYTKLFPRENVHLFHSSYSLMWRSQGHVEKDKLDSFNLPYYAPSMKEVKELINKNALFEVDQIKLFESNWDPQDDSEGEVVIDCDSSGANVTKCIRAVMEPLVVDHFGEGIVEELFMVFASIVAKHLEKAKPKYPIIMVSLKKTMH